MIRAVVNADDFGISCQVNEAIRQSFEKGLITQTTLMVNMPCAPDAVALARAEGFDDRVGLHLNLTAGTPLTEEIKGFPIFCDENGEFNAAFHRSTFSRFFISPTAGRALSKEIAAQIERYLAYGLTLGHLDSHHHAHTDPAVWKHLTPAIKDSGFQSVRIGRNIYLDDVASGFNRLYKKWFNSSVRHTGVFAADNFGSFKDFKYAFDRLADGALAEIMVHPLLSETGELLDTDLPMGEMGEFLESRGVTLLSYRELRA